MAALAAMEIPAEMAMEDEKIGDLIRDEAARAKAAGVAPVPFSSVEYFPPRTDQGVANLRERLARMAETEPLFVDFTWGAGGSTAELTLGLTLECKQRLGLRTNMHLTCTNMPVEKVDDALRACRAHGITNIVALRGDPPRGESEWQASEGGFACARDLVEYIRAQHGDYFHISVAGYPEGHPDRITLVDSPGGIDQLALSDSERARCSVTVDAEGVERVYVCRDEAYAAELAYLKAKVDAGADLILTQMFFDSDVFLRFVHACRAVGINVPILPGVMCLNAYAGFKRMVNFCHTRVPPEVMERVEAIGSDDEAMKAYGIEYGTEMCRRLLAAGAPGLHFYTLNLERVVVGILKQLGMQGHYSDEVRPEDTAQMLDMIKSAKSVQTDANGSSSGSGSKKSSSSGSSSGSNGVAHNGSSSNGASPPRSANGHSSSNGNGAVAANGLSHKGSAANGSSSSVSGVGVTANGHGSPNGSINGSAARNSNSNGNINGSAVRGSVGGRSDASEDYQVADLALADEGRREIALAQAQVPGLMSLRSELAVQQPLRSCRVVGSLALTAQTAVLVETLAALGADVRWCAASPTSTEDAVAAALAAAGTAAVFAWREQTLEEHWACKLQALGGRRGHRGPDLLVDENGELALLLQRAIEVEAVFAESGTLPEAAALGGGAEGAAIAAALEEALLTSRDLGERLRSSSQSLLDAAASADSVSTPGRWEALARGIAGLVEGTAAGRQRLQKLAEAGRLRVAAVCRRGQATLQEAEQLEYRDALMEALCNASDAPIAGKRAVVCGYGGHGKACAAALLGAGAAVDVAESDPVCALQAALDGYRVVELSEALINADICINTVACASVITAEHMTSMRDGALVASAAAGQRSDEASIDIAGLVDRRLAERETLKPQVDKYTFLATHRHILVLCEGRSLLDAGTCPVDGVAPTVVAAGGSGSGSGGQARKAAAAAAAVLPHAAASATLTGLVLALLELWKEHGRFVAAEAGDNGTPPTPKYQAGKLYDLPKALDEKVARVHLPSLGAKLTKLSLEQAEYLERNSSDATRGLDTTSTPAYRY